MLLHLTEPFSKLRLIRSAYVLTIERLATTRAALFNKTSLIWIRLAVAVNPFPESQSLFFAKGNKTPTKNLNILTYLDEFMVIG